MREGLDYSADRISGEDIKAAGYDFVVRYLWFPGQGLAYLTADEHADLVDNGIEVHAVYEEGTNDPGGGYEGGKAMARQAAQSARGANLPRGTVIFFCADAWLRTSVLNAMAFLDGARSELEAENNEGYIIGAYGFTDFIYAAQDGGHADRFWLCGAEDGMREGIHLYQWNNGNTNVAGVTCDINKMYQELGTPVVEDDDMALKDQSVPIYQVEGGTDTREKMGADEAIGRTVQASWTGVYAVERLEKKMDALNGKLDALATLVGAKLDATNPDGGL